MRAIRVEAGRRACYSKRVNSTSPSIVARPLALALSVTASLALVACSGPRAADTGSPSNSSTETHVSAIDGTRAWLADFEAAYHYDVGYMEQLLELSPTAYETFAGAMGMGELHEHLPTDAHHVGTIAALMADDCGQCTQLGLRLAVEAGVERELLRTLLESPDQLPDDLRLVRDYATRVGSGGNADAATVAALRATYGDAGFGELAVNVLGVRIYPALRRAMGAETVCPPPTLDF